MSTACTTGFIKSYHQPFSLLTNLMEKGTWSHLEHHAAYKTHTISDSCGRLIVLRPGQLATRLTKLAPELGLSYKELRGMLGRFARRGMLKFGQSVGKAFTIITLCTSEVFSDEIRVDDGPRAIGGKCKESIEYKNQESLLKEGMTPPSPAAPSVFEGRLASHATEATTRRRRSPEPDQRQRLIPLIGVVPAKADFTLLKKEPDPAPVVRSEEPAASDPTPKLDPALQRRYPPPKRLRVLDATGARAYPLDFEAAWAAHPRRRDKDWQPDDKQACYAEYRDVMLAGVDPGLVLKEAKVAPRCDEPRYQIGMLRWLRDRFWSRADDPAERALTWDEQLVIARRELAERQAASGTGA